MRNFTLKRIASDGNRTFGVLIDNAVPFAVTLEDAWKSNEQNVSCIPAGTYLCTRIDSPRFGKTFEVRDVEGRDHILFHCGNTEEDTHGCILVGEEFGTLGSSAAPAILRSRAGFQEFMKRLERDTEFLLCILWT